MRTRVSALPTSSRLHWFAKSRSTSRGGVVRLLVWSIAIEWPLLKVQRSVASQDDEWQVPVVAVFGPQNLTGCSQSKLDLAVHARSPGVGLLGCRSGYVV